MIDSRLFIRYYYSLYGKTFAKGKNMELIKQPLPVRTINGLMLLLEKLGSDIITIDKDRVLAEAMKKTGLPDFGHRQFFDAIEKLNECVKSADLAPFGKFIGKFCVRIMAANRLRVEDYVRRHPEATQMNLDRSLFVLGFPRSGTTMLQNVLCMGKNYRGIHFYEIITPYPLDDDPVKDRKKRIRRVLPLLLLVKIGAPDMDTAHEFKADSLEEDWILKGITLCTANTDLGTGMTDWNDWVMSQDRTWIFEEFKRLLQIQMSLNPADYMVLKSANHLWSIELLLKMFPRACFVWIHRNPFESVASFSSLQGKVRGFFKRSFDPKEVGAAVLKRFSQGISHALEVRKKFGDEFFLDLDYDEVLADIPGAVKKVRGYFSMPHGEAEDREIREWLASPRKDDRGKHIYTAEKWGITRESVQKEFGDYIERFKLRV